MDRWKYHYIFASFLLIVSSFVRMLEPKILQIAIDGVVVFFNSNGQKVVENPDVIAQFFYDILPTIRMDNIPYILLCIGGVLVAVSIIRVGTQFWASIITASVTERAIKNLRDYLFRHIQLLPLNHLNKTPTADLIQRCTGDVDTVRNFISTQIIEVVRLTALFIGAMVMMLSVHVTYALISVMLVPFVTILAVFFFKREGKVWEQHEKEQDKLTNIIQENLSGIRVVQAFAKEEYEMERFHKQNIEKRKIGLKHVDLHKNYWTFSDLLVNAQIVISLLAGGYYVLNGAVTIGEFISFFSYSLVVTWPMRQVGRIVSQMGMATVAMERMGQIIDAQEEDYEGEELEALNGEIEFKNVVFKYAETDESNALNGISFKVNAGEKIALLGATGSGKSTIITLLSRLYEPTEGEILIDGQPLANLNKTFIRSQIGVVHQKPFLFSSTIKENIAFTKPDASMEEIEAMAEAAQVASFIPKMRDSYDTVVGEKGVTLSGGQKQRVALARTLLSNPSILVLDDATSAVDTETEFDIQAALTEHAKGKTTFMIAHRLTSIQQADRIMVLDKGEIVEIGTHEELLAQNGFYKKVYDIQIAIEEDIEQEILLD